MRHQAEWRSRKNRSCRLDSEANNNTRLVCVGVRASRTHDGRALGESRSVAQKVYLRGRMH